jgi:hypothetical protein
MANPLPVTTGIHPRFGEVLVFRATAASEAPPAAVYDVLADLSTHLQWGGPGSASKGNQLVTLSGPAGLATAGTTFTSTGKAGKDVFHDRSTVTEASPGRRFAFTTQARLERRRKPAWLVEFTHDYQLAPAGSGTAISYTCAVHPQNYIPYWLQPWMKPMVRVMMQRVMAANVASLGRLAAG